MITCYISSKRRQGVVVNYSPRGDRRATLLAHLGTHHTTRPSALPGPLTGNNCLQRYPGDEEPCERAPRERGPTLSPYCKTLARK